jgi:outer membrane lipoprotein-sorting protein
MKISIIAVSVLLSFFLLGCTQKVNVASINEKIMQNQTSDIKTFLENKTINTYDKEKGKITTYYFKDKNGNLAFFDTFTYVPLDSTDQLYDPFSQVTWTLNRLTNYKAKTIEEALDENVKENGSVRLFNDKKEYIINNNFARDLIMSIKEFNEMIERQENDHQNDVILPIR